MRSKKLFKKNRKTIKKYRKSYKQEGGDKYILISILTGGLGNRLFQIFAAYGFAEKWNMNVKVFDNGLDHLSGDDSMNHMKQLFPNLEIINKDTNISNYLVLDEEEQFIYHDIQNPNNNARLNGYFQSEKYFPTNPPIINLVEPLNNILVNIDTNRLFFIHIRLGDYIGNESLNHSKNSNSLELYYKTCIKKIKDTYNNAIFIIITNDTNTAKKYINDLLIGDLSGNQLIYADDSSSSRLDSLYYMAQCKGGIAVNSTFSWFGTYLIKNNDKKFIFIIKPWYATFDKNKIHDVYPSWTTPIDVNLLSGGSKKRKTHKKRIYKGGDKSKAYVINLDKRIDRWKQIQERFKNSSIELERISAVENEDGYLGCSLSFLKVVQKAKDLGLPSVLIFEDDNKPLENFDKRWRTVKKWLDSNLDKWDIFNGGAAWEYFERDEHAKLFDIKLKYELEDNINLFTCNKVMRANWIYINSSVFDKVLKWSRDMSDTNINKCIDLYFGSGKYFTILCIFPFLGIQENGKSDLMKIEKNVSLEDNHRDNFMNKILNEQHHVITGGYRFNYTPFTYDDVIVFTITSNGYKDLTYNLWKSIDNLQVKWKLMIICLDKESEAYFKSKNIEIILYDTSSSSKNLTIFGSNEFMEYNHTKLDLIELIRKEAPSSVKYIIFMDSDIVVLNDFIPYLKNLYENTTNSIYFQSDNDYNDFLSNTNTIACTGFFIVKRDNLEKSPFIIDDQAEWEKIREDQPYVNMKLKKYNIQYEYLDRKLFPNGAFIKGNMHSLNQNLWNNPFILHYNYIMGDNKIQSMKNNKHWYIEE